MTKQEQLERELKELIITTLALEGVTEEDIEPEAPLVGDGLGLDSIDVLELGTALKRRYGIKFDGDSEETRSKFSSLRTLAAYIDEKRAQ